MWQESLKDCLTDSYRRGEMLISQKRDVISLLPTENKDSRLLKYCQPITMLHIHYSHEMYCTAVRESLANVDQ